MPLTVTELHGAVTYFPIAMLIAAVAFEFGAAIFRKSEWRVVSFWLLVTAVISSIPSLVTGWILGNQMFGSVANPPQVFTLHRLLAFVVSGMALIYLVWRVAVKDKLEKASLGASLVLCLAIFGVVSYTGYLGGAMAVGTTNSAPIQTASASSATSAPAPKLDPTPSPMASCCTVRTAAAAVTKSTVRAAPAGRIYPDEAVRNADIDWQVKHLKDPAKVKPGSFMPAYGTLGADKLKAMAEYMVSLK